MWSFWERDSFIGQPDFIIIGSGIVGLSAAISLKTAYPLRSVLIVESGHLPSGASTKNAGFACFGSPSELSMDLKSSPKEAVFSLVKKRFDGLTQLRAMLGDKNIQYEAPGSFELFETKSQLEKTAGELASLNKQAKAVLGFAPYEVSKNVLSDYGFKNFAGAIQIHGEGQIDTGKMMKALIKKAQSTGVEIINGLKVIGIHNEPAHIVVTTDYGPIKASKCLVATNGFAKKLLPELEIVPARAQVLITKPIPHLKIRGTFHFDEGFYYFRNVGNRILFGGGRNINKKEEETNEIQLNEEIQHTLKTMLQQNILPNHTYQIDQQWAGIMGLGHQKTPIVQQLTPNLFCAVRLGGMGIAIGSLIGQEGANLMAL